MYCFNVGLFMFDVKRMCIMNLVFVFVLIVFFVFGELVDIVVSVYRIMQECMIVVIEQKIFGNCYLVDKVIYQDNIEISVGF